MYSGGDEGDKRKKILIAIVIVLVIIGITLLVWFLVARKSCTSQADCTIWPFDKACSIPSGATKGHCSTKSS